MLVADFYPRNAPHEVSGAKCPLFGLVKSDEGADIIGGGVDDGGGEHVISFLSF